MSPLLKSDEGFGLVEGMIAAAVLVVVSATVAYMSMNSMRSSLTLEKYTGCQQLANGVIQEFKNDEGSLRIRNYAPAGIQKEMMGDDHPAWKNPMTSYDGAYDENLAMDLGGKRMYMNHQLIENTIHRAVMVARNGYCFVPTGVAADDLAKMKKPYAPLNPALSTALQQLGATAYLNIYVDQTDDDPRMQAMAAGIVTKGKLWCPDRSQTTDVFPNSGSQVVVSTRIDIPGSGGCGAENRISYTADHTPPKISVTFNNIAGRMRNGMSCGYDNSISVNDRHNPYTVDRVSARTISYSLTASEPGVMFECSLDGKTWYPCADKNFEKATGGSISFKVNADAMSAPTTATLKIIWPDLSATRTVYFDAIDSSGDPRNWASGHPEQHGFPGVAPWPGGGTVGSASVKINLDRPNLSNVSGSVDATGPAPLTRNFLCQKRDTRVSYKVNAPFPGDTQCACYVQRGAQSGNLFPYFGSDLYPECASCQAVLIKQSQIDALVGTSENNSAEVTVGIQVRDECNDPTCAYITGGFGSGAAYWDKCFDPQKFAASANAQYKLEITPTPDNLKTMVIEPANAAFPSGSGPSWQLTTYSGSHLRSGGDEAFYQNAWGPQTKVEYKSFGGMGTPYAWTPGGITGGVVLKSSDNYGAMTQSGCADGRVSARVSDGCPAHGTPATSVATYSIKVREGQPCHSNVECDDGLFCDNGNRCERLPAQTFGNHTFQSDCTTKVPCSSTNFSDYCRCDNYAPADPLASPFPKPATGGTWRYLGYGNTGGGLAPPCADLTLGNGSTAKPNPMPVIPPAALPPPAPRDCNGIATQIDNSANRIPDTSGSQCGCMQMCQTSGTIPAECKFQGMTGTSGSNPTATTDLFSVPGTFTDPSDPAKTQTFEQHCGQYYITILSIYGPSPGGGVDNQAACNNSNKCPVGSEPLPPSSMCDLLDGTEKLYNEAVNNCVPHSIPSSCKAAMEGTDSKHLPPAKAVCAH